MLCTTFIVIFLHIVTDVLINHYTPTMQTPFLGAIKGSSLPFVSPGFSSTSITAEKLQQELQIPPPQRHRDPR